MITVLWRYTFFPCKNYKTCHYIISFVCVSLDFSRYKYFIFTPNWGRYTPKSPFSSPNGLLSTLNSFSGYVSVSAIPSVCRCWWDMLHAWSALRTTIGRGGYKWVRLRMCTHKNWHKKPNSQFDSRVCKILETQAPRSVWEYDLATVIAIQTLTCCLLCEMGSSVFAAMSWLKVASMTWSWLSRISSTENERIKKICFSCQFHPCLSFFIFPHLGKSISIPSFT